MEIVVDPDRDGIFVGEHHYSIKALKLIYGEYSREQRLEIFGTNSYTIYQCLVKHYSHHGDLVQTVRTCQDLYDDVIQRVEEEVDVDELLFIFQQIEAWMHPFMSLAEHDMDEVEIQELKDFQRETMELIRENLMNLENNEYVACVAFGTYTPEFTLLDLVNKILNKEGDVVYWVECMMHTVTFYQEELC